VGHELEERERVPWVYRSPCYQALHLRFGVRCADPDVGAYLDHVLSGLRRDQDEPEIWYSVGRSGTQERPYSVQFGSELLSLTHSKAFAIETLLWHINGAIVDRADPFVVLHAGGVALEGVGAIISGPSGAGKTTLTAALVRAGFRYLTDEALAIDPATHLLHPYPKALNIRSGSWELLPDLRPPPSDLAQRAWRVAPTDIRPDAIAGPTPPSVVLFPRLGGSQEPDGLGGLQEVPRSEAAVELFQQRFRPSEAPTSALALRVLAGVLEGCACFRVSTADLGRAVDHVTEVMRAR
jgi:hypothetical protein